jgi:hypothetical protein
MLPYSFQPEEAVGTEGFGAGFGFSEQAAIAATAKKGRRRFTK